MSRQTLYVQRHADAGDPIADDTAADRARMLTELGRHQAWWVGQVLREWDVEPTIIIASPLPRAAETAYIMSETIGVPVELAPDLEPHLNVYDLLRAWVNDDDFEDALIIGHHDNLLPTLAALNGVFPKFDADGNPEPYAEFHRGELRKLKFDKNTLRWDEKWRIHPAPDQMTMSAGVYQDLGVSSR